MTQDLLWQTAVPMKDHHGATYDTWIMLGNNIFIVIEIEILGVRHAVKFVHYVQCLLHLGHLEAVTLKI